MAGTRKTESAMATEAETNVHRLNVARPDLPPQFRVGEYELREVLATSRTGITYSAWDPDRGEQIAIKEFLFAEVAARRQDGSVAPRSPAVERSFAELLEQFLDAARALADVRHDNLLRILDVTETNGTGYVAMDHAGESTLDVMLRTGALGRPELDAIMAPLLDGLEALHNADLLHLELRPDKIALRADGSPVILASGATRQGFATARRSFGNRARDRRLIRSPSSYAPIELYSAETKWWGPWTDIYALGSIFYECVSGEVPPAAAERLIADSIGTPSEPDSEDFDPAIRSGIQASMAIRPADRPQQVATWRNLLTDGEAKPRGADGNLARTSARGARIPANGSTEASSAAGGRRRWAIPALALLAATGLIVYFDSQLLRSPVDEEAPAQQTADWQSPIAQSTERITSRATPDLAALFGPAADKDSAVVEQARNATLTVETTPPNAEVWVAGRFVGKTPLSLRDQPEGTFEVVLHHPHFERVVLADQSFEADQELRIDRTLTRGKGNLMVTTEPAGAWVEWDDRRLIESTPGLLSDLPAGLVELRVGAPGRESVKVLAEVPKDATGYLAHELVVAVEP